MLKLFMKGATVSGPPPRGHTLSIETPTISKPWLRYLSWSLTKSGISTRHGPHQTAQKLSMTTLPRYSSRLVERLDVGTGVAETVVDFPPFEQEVDEITKPPARTARTIAIIIGARRRRGSLFFFVRDINLSNKELNHCLKMISQLSDLHSLPRIAARPESESEGPFSLSHAGAARE